MNLIENADDDTATMRTVVDDHERMVQKTDQRVETVEIDSETEMRLEDLGYK